MGNTSQRIEAFTGLVEPIAEDFGVELVDIEQNGDVVKIVIDQPNGLESGVLVEVTKAVSRMVDAEDPIPGTFTLEITSPGLERPLKKPAHFVRAVGETVSVKTNPDVDGDRRVDGLLASADDDGIVVSTATGEERALAYHEIRTARTVFDWSPTPKPGGAKSPKNESPNPSSTTKESASR